MNDKRPPKEWAGSVEPQDDVTVKFRVVDPGETGPDPKQSVVEIVEIHRYPYLLPFGLTTIRIDKQLRTWTGKCGQFRIEGSGVNVNKIAEMMVKLCGEELKKIERVVRTSY